MPQRALPHPLNALSALAARSRPSIHPSPRPPTATSILPAQLGYRLAACAATCRLRTACMLATWYQIRL